MLKHSNKRSIWLTVDLDSRIQKGVNNHTECVVTPLTGKQLDILSQHIEKKMKSLPAGVTVYITVTIGQKFKKPGQK